VGEKPPAFQWYAKDWLTDDKRTEMSPAQRGVHIDFMSYQWVNTSIPNDIDKLATIAGVPVAEMRELWVSPLVDCYVANGSGRLQNPRLEKERDAKLKYLDKMAKAGRKGAKGRWRKDGHPNG